MWAHDLDFTVECHEPRFDFQHRVLHTDHRLDLSELGSVSAFPDPDLPSVFRAENGLVRPTIPTIHDDDRASVVKLDRDIETLPEGFVPGSVPFGNDALPCFSGTAVRPNLENMSVSALSSPARAAR